MDVTGKSLYLVRRKEEFGKEAKPSSHRPLWPEVWSLTSMLKKLGTTNGFQKNNITIIIITIIIIVIIIIISIKANLY